MIERTCPAGSIESKEISINAILLRIQNFNKRMRRISILNLWVACATDIKYNVK